MQGRQEGNCARMLCQSEPPHSKQSLTAAPPWNSTRQLDEEADWDSEHPGMAPSLWQGCQVIICKYNQEKNDRLQAKSYEVNSNLIFQVRKWRSKAIKVARTLEVQRKHGIRNPVYFLLMHNPVRGDAASTFPQEGKVDCQREKDTKKLPESTHNCRRKRGKAFQLCWLRETAVVPMPLWAK